MADTKTEGTAEPLQTVGDALDALGSEILAKFAKNVTPDQSETAGEPIPEKVEATPENNGDLSQIEPEQKPDDDDDLPADTKARIQKRIDKVTAKQKAAEEKAAQLEAEREARDARLKELEGQLQELKTKQPEQPAVEPDAKDDPLLRVPEIKKIWDAEQKANEAYEAAKDFRKRLKRDPERTLEELSKTFKNIRDVDDAEDVLETIKENAFRQSNDLQLRRRLAGEQYMRSYHEAQRKEVDDGLKLYPWINDAKAKEQEIAAKYLKQFPQLKGAPKLLGRLVVGEMAEAKLAEQPKPAPVIPPKVPTPTKVAAPQKVDDAADIEKLMQQAVARGGSDEDLAAIILRKGT